MVALLGLDLFVTCISLGWSFAAGDVDANDTFGSILRLLFLAYLFAVAIPWIFYDQIDMHWPVTVHISALSFLAFALLGVTAILPDVPLPSTSGLQGYSAVLQVLWYTSFVLLLAITTIAINIPRGPLLHYPSERVYSEKTMALTTTHVPDNVCGLPSNESRFWLSLIIDESQVHHVWTFFCSHTQPKSLC